MRKEKCVTCEAFLEDLAECDECGALICKDCRIFCVVCGSVLCVNCAERNAEKEFVCPSCVRE